MIINEKDFDIELKNYLIEIANKYETTISLKHNEFKGGYVVGIADEVYNSKAFGESESHRILDFMKHPRHEEIMFLFPWENEMFQVIYTDFFEPGDEQIELKI